MEHHRRGARQSCRRGSPAGAGPATIGILLGQDPVEVLPDDHVPSPASSSTHGAGQHARRSAGIDDRPTGPIPRSGRGRASGRRRAFSGRRLTTVTRAALRQRGSLQAESVAAELAAPYIAAAAETQRLVEPVGGHARRRRQRYDLRVRPRRTRPRSRPRAPAATLLSTSRRPRSGSRSRCPAATRSAARRRRGINTS